MKMCEFLVAASTALIITGNETYGVVAFVLSMLGLLFRTSIEMQFRLKDQEKNNQEIAKKIGDSLIEEAKKIFNNNLNSINARHKNFN